MRKINIVFTALMIFSSLLYVSASAADDPIIKAAKSGNIKTLQDMLGAGSNVNTFDSSGKSLLLIAVSNGKFAAAKFLLDEGAIVNKNDQKGNTILHYLASNSKAEALELMKYAIEKGADIDFTNFNSPRQMPAEIAIRKGNIPALEILMSSGFRPDSFIDNKPMLIFAYEVKQLKVMKLLAEKGAKLDAENNVKDALIHIAVQKSDLATVKYLAEKGAQVNRKGSAGRTPLFMAVEKGNIKIAEYLISLQGDVNAVDNSGRNIMHLLAAAKNNSKTITAFSAYNININKADSSGRTPLVTAINEKRWENVKTLVDAGADFKIIDSTGKSILTLAIENKNTDVASYLIEKGIDIKRKDTSGRTPLHAVSALKGKSWDGLMALLIKKGADVNGFDNTGVSPAGICIDAGNSSGFIIMLNNGLNINLKERNTDPLVLYSYKKKEKVIFGELIKLGADIKQKDGEGNTIFHLAAEKDDRAYFTTLLPMNPDLNLKNKAGRTPLLLAIEKGKLLFAKMLLEQKDSINLKLTDSQGMSVLHYLATVKGAMVCLSMIEVTPDWVKQDDSLQRTPLALAVNANLTDNADFFIKSGADVNGSDWNSSKLVISAYEKSKSMLDLLLLNGADPGAVNADEKNLFFLTIEKNDLPTLKLLVEKKADINTKYMGGMNPLNHAIDKGRTSIIQFLVLSGANLNMKDNSGNTPLITAALKKDFSTASLLVKGGADVNITTADGKSVLFIAYDKNKPDIFDLALSGGALSNAKFENGNTFLHLAASANRLSFITSLIKNKCEINALNIDGKTAVMLAAEKGYSNAVKALIAGTADPNIKDKTGETALFKCIKTGGDGGYYSADALIKGGAQINDKNSAGSPLLHEAAAAERFSMIDLFLKNGGDPNILNQKNETLIMILSKTPYTGTKDQAKSSQAAKLIIDLTARGSNPDIADKYSRTPLDIACKVKNMTVVAALLKGGAKVDSLDGSGNTSLKKVIMSYIGDYKVSEKEKKSVLLLIDLLIKNGAQVNLQDKFGCTPLTHIMKEANQKNFQKVADLVPELLKRGALTDIKDNDGKSASDYASSSSIAEINGLLR